ncbi:MAG: site-specific DNA-methyltransferase [Chloroflexi bacterium]|nr:site-specific DNA-methyltransferase [Chloroflexota bacterium]
MPTLQFKGKNIIWNHHLSVPYHALDDVSKLSYKPEIANGNLIIEGDNLLALKSLLPLYAGQIHCIYIDPPYNTGNEGWVYNDNVNSPLIKDWLGKEVGKDDLTRHDKWLCMMTPRLKLLRDLLADDGAIFISIEDNEVYNLRAVMNEIFGEENFVAEFVWKKRTGSNDSKEFWRTTDHEYVVSYAKTNLFQFAGIEKTFLNYSNPDNDPRGDWAVDNLTCNKTSAERPHLFYDITDPKTNITYKCNPNRVWVYEPDRMKRLIKEGKVIFPKDGKGTPTYKRHLSEVRSNKKPLSTWVISRSENEEIDEEILSLQFPLNMVATKQLTELMGSLVFNNPKSVDMIKQIVYQATDVDSVILDSFAGSGTTAHAILDLNKEDGGNRKFILVQMTEATPAEPKKNICKDITRERVKRAIDKFGYKSGFEYMRVGLPIDSESLLAGKLPVIEQFGSYVFFLCTGEKTTKPVKSIEKNLYLAGSQGNADIYLIYSQDYEELTRLALNLDWAEKIVTSDKKRYIVYAPACFLDEDYLRSKQIEFVNIPYGLFQRKEN